MVANARYSAGDQLDVVTFASPNYWPDREELGRTEKAVQAAIVQHCGSDCSESVNFHWIRDDDCSEHFAQLEGHEAALFVPLSGGTQPWMTSAANRYRHIGLANVYLSNALGGDHSAKALCRNAHPAATDFFAHQRMRGNRVQWLAPSDELTDWLRGWNAARCVRRGRLLKIGETEQWVVNSCRSPDRFRERWGTEIVPIGLDVLYDRVNATSEGEAETLARDWIQRATALVDVGASEVTRSARVVLAMQRLLAEHQADGLSIACFTLIRELDTTSCMATAFLNEAKGSLAACEGDLDAAVTMLLMKSLGADFVWIGNPIIHGGPYIDLVHCTAPRGRCGSEFPHRLLPHHESGRGVAPEVALPEGETVSLVRIGNDLTQVAAHIGKSERIEKQPACHTQLRVVLDTSDDFVNHLLGTHYVLSFGDFQRPIRSAARFLGLEVLPRALGRPQSKELQRESAVCRA